MSDHGIARDQLRAFIERIERLEEEKKAIADDIKEVKAEAKGSGFSVPIINEIIKIRKMDRNDRAEREALLDMYLHALGMAPDPDDGPDGGVKIIDRQDSDGNHLTVTVDRRIAEVLGRDDRAMAEAVPHDFNTEPQPSLMAGKAAASIPPEVAAEIDTPETANETVEAQTGPLDTDRAGHAHDEVNHRNAGGDHEVAQALHGQSNIEKTQVPAPLNAGGVSDARALGNAVEVGSTNHQSSDLHDGRLQAVPAPALDESRDSAAGVEAPAAPVNPRCLKHQRGEECKFSHKRSSCWQCNQAAELQRAGAA